MTPTEASTAACSLEKKSRGFAVDRKRIDFAWRAIALGALCSLLSGCVSDMLARKIVTAPNRQNAPWPVKGSEAAQHFEQAYALQFRVTVGPPAAELAVAVVEPGNYAFRYGTIIKVEKNGRRVPRYSANWQPRADEPAIEARGTVVLLHGFLVSKETMMHWALFLAQQGYRTVLVDLRGHGQSTGEWITFGAAEASDLVKVADELERRGLTGKGIAVLGSSYGAVMALHWAARDARVKGVVALEPFSESRRAVVEFARGFPAFKKQVENFGERTFEMALDRAALLGSFSWANTDVLASVKRISAPVLFFHGAEDTWIAPEHSRTLLSAAPTGSRLVIVPADSHETLSARLDPIADDVLDWLQQEVQRDAFTRSNIVVGSATNP